MGQDAGAAMKEMKQMGKHALRSELRAGQAWPETQKVSRRLPCTKG